MQQKFGMRVDRVLARPVVEQDSVDISGRIAGGGSQIQVVMMVRMAAAAASVLAMASSVVMAATAGSVRGMGVSDRSMLLRWRTSLRCCASEAVVN